MKITQIKILNEGKPAETCPNCSGTPIHKTHRILGKNAAGETVWKCKTGTTYVRGGGSAVVTTRYGAGGSTASSAPASSTTGTTSVGGGTSPTSTPSAASTPRAAKAAADPALEEAKQKRAAWLDHHHITKYTINNDLSVDVKETVSIHKYQHSSATIPLKFGTVKGSFVVEGCSFTTMKNGPTQVDGEYYMVDNCPLVSLEGFPKQVKNVMLVDVPSLQLKSDHRIEVEGKVTLHNCGLKNLEGIEKVFSCATLELTDVIYGDILNIMDIRGLKQVNINPVFEGSSIDSITGFEMVKVYQQLTKLINKSLSEGGDMIILQDDLIQAGLGAFAGLDFDDPSAKIPDIKGVPFDQVINLARTPKVK